MKVVTIIGTRPEIIKLSAVINELDKYFEHILVHTGQNYDYELNEIFFNDLEIRKPNYFLNCVDTVLSKTIANIISKSDEIFDIEKPDAVLVLGDTNSCLSTISAKRKKIPIFHMEAGNRCFDQRVPEEINRKIVDHISDINLVYTEHARRYLLSEGIKPDYIIKTGSPMKEVINNNLYKIRKSSILEQLGLEKNKYFIVSLHREENVDTEESLLKIMISLDKISEKYKYPIIVSTHPRTKSRLEALNYKHLNSNIRFLKPFGFSDYCNLQLNATCVISDSGTITEESSILNFPAITIRQMHERPEGMDNGTLIMSGLEYNNILNAIKIVIDQSESSSIRIPIVNDYDVDSVAVKIPRIISSYTEFVNKNIWKK